MRAVVIVLLVVVLGPAAAFARSEKTLAYPRDEAWPAAVRFIRVDLALKVLEKDADAGYVLFELHEDNKTFRGSLEVIEVVKDGRHLVRFVVQIEDRPAWIELDMLGRLEHKLRVELGAPAEPKPKDRDEPKDKPKDEAKPKDKAKDEPKHDDSPTDDGPPISPTP